MPRVGSTGNWNLSPDTLKMMRYRKIKKKISNTFRSMVEWICEKLVYFLCCGCFRKKSPPYVSPTIVVLSYPKPPGSKPSGQPPQKWAHKTHHALPAAYASSIYPG